MVGIFTSCKKTDEIENHGNYYIEANSTYFFQLYVRENSDLARTSADRKFGSLSEISEPNDSSAYVFAFKVAELARGESQDVFSDIIEFKLYNSHMVEITNSISFEGIELYPNPYK